MEYNVYSIDKVSNDFIKNIINDKQSFVLEGISRTMMPEVISKVEEIIENSNFKCRVYTKGRSIGLAAIPSPAMFAGLATGIGIGIHNLATYNPDYEIAKNYIMGTLTIEYKK